MKFTEIYNILENLKIFSINDFKQIDTNFDKKKIYLWKKKGLIKSIYKGYYILNSQRIDKTFLYKIANTVYFPSYIGMESALNYYKLIPEAVYTITCITTKKTNEINNDFINISYKSIKTDLFWGYKIITINNNNFLISEIEKTLLDFFYLNKQVNDENDMIGLRLNSEILNKNIDRKKLTKYLKIFNKKFLTKKIELLFNLLDKGLI